MEKKEAVAAIHQILDELTVLEADAVLSQCKTYVYNREQKILEGASFKEEPRHRQSQTRRLQIAALVVHVIAVAFLVTALLVNMAARV